MVYYGVMENGRSCPKLEDAGPCSTLLDATRSGGTVLSMAWGTPFHGLLHYA